MVNILAAVNPLVLTGAVVVFVLIVLVLAILQTRCPKCGKVFGAQRMSRKPGSGPNRWIDHNRCKSCGHEWDREFTKSSSSHHHHHHHHHHH
jgi:transposase-like protein